MRNRFLLVFIILFLFTSTLPAEKEYDAQEPWLARRISDWQDLKFGFFVHWGMYSQWGCIESWPLVEVDEWARPDDLPAWVERGKDMELFTRDYWKLKDTFNPTRFNPEKWVEAAQSAGMKYFVFTTKHHDGFSMFDTQYTDFKSTSPGCPFHKDPNADAAKVLFDAFRAEDFWIGAYFSKADWHSPYYWSPDAPARTRNPNYDTLAEPEKWGKFVEFVHNQVEELMTGYGPIDILWLDAGQVKPPKQDIDMDRLVRMARSHQPELIVVDRAVGGKHENYLTPEQKVPDVPPAYPWETCMTMGDQWSYKPDDDYKSTRELVHLLVNIVSKGGNLLLNVGPGPDGRLPEEALVRMEEIGKWLDVNGEGIYGTRPVAPYREGQVCLTQKEGVVYAICLAEEGKIGPPSEIRLSSVVPKPGSKIRILGSDENLAWRMQGGGVVIEIPAEAGSICQDAWVVKVEM